LESLLQDSATITKKVLLDIRVFWNGSLASQNIQKLVFCTTSLYKPQKKAKTVSLKALVIGVAGTMTTVV
jgi:hypothetical protein